LRVTELVLHRSSYFYKCRVKERKGKVKDGWKKKEEKKEKEGKVCIDYSLIKTSSPLNSARSVAFSILHPWSFFRSTGVP